MDHLWQAPSPQPTTATTRSGAQVCLVAFAPHQPRSHMGERFFGDTYSLSAVTVPASRSGPPAMSRTSTDISQATLTQGNGLYYTLCSDSGSYDIRTSLFPITPPGCVPCFGYATGPSSPKACLFQDLRAGVTWGIRKVSYGLSVSTSPEFSCCKLTPRIEPGRHASVNYRLSPLTNLYGNLDWIEPGPVDSFRPWHRPGGRPVFLHRRGHHEFGREPDRGFDLPALLAGFETTRQPSTRRINNHGFGHHEFLTACLHAQPLA